MQQQVLRTILLSVITATAGAFAQSAAGSPRWYWFQSCGKNSTMGVEVLLDGRLVYRSSFPICKTTDASSTKDRKQKILAFSFKGQHVFQGEYHTTSTQTTEGNIWQAGTDPDDLILGVSFVSRNQILLNTILIARPGSPSASEVDRGIIVKTFPVSPPG